MITNMGVYAIINKKNGNTYIGSSNNLQTRQRLHFQKLNDKMHGNRLLQEDFNIYGNDKFEFVVLEYTDTTEILEILEDIYYHKYKHNRKMYNIVEIYRAKEGIITKTQLKEFIATKYKPKRERISFNKGTNNGRVTLTMEDCFAIKEQLLEQNNEKMMDKYNRLALEYNCSAMVIRNIRSGRHWSTEQLGGSLEDWLK